MMRLVLVGVAIAAIGATFAATAATLEKCSAPSEKLLGADLFRRYPAKTVIEIRPVPPRIDAAARPYRTAIREGAKSGANFAGHYTIIEPGCGTNTVCPAIVDALTGKVFLPSDFHAATSLSAYKDIGSNYVAALNYNVGSRLLVVAGDVDDDPKRMGLSYYVFTAGQLQLVRFVPMAMLCH